MSKQIINTTLSPDVRIDQTGGDLSIKGWESPQIQVKADPETLTMEDQEDQVNLSCNGDLELRLPYGASIQIGTVHGDAQLKLLDEALVIGSVMGSLTLRNVADAQIENVYGDLSARNLSGDLHVKSVKGTVEARQVQGNCYLAQVMGDLDLRGIEGEVKASANGSARLELSLATGSDYTLQSLGDVRCTVPEDAGLKLDLTSQSNVIRVQVPGDNRNIRQGHVAMTIGDGGAAMTISCNGALYFQAEGSGWAETSTEEATPSTDFSDQVRRQVEAQVSMQMAEMTRQINEQMARVSQMLGESGMKPEETERIVAEAMRTSEVETALAQEKVRRAQEKLERKLEAAQRRADQKAQAAERRTRRHSWGFEWPAPPPPPAPPGAGSRPVPPMPPVRSAPPPPNPVSEEERLMILRMLEQKKISLEEADRLLSALEGKE
jgi:hypothetical protein